MNSTLRIAIPDNPLFDELISRINVTKSDFEPVLIRSQKPNIHSYLTNNLADVALLSPLEYGLASVSTDLRIVPATCLAGVSYTGLMSIIFQPGLKDVQNCAILNENDFLTLAAKIVLKEKYDLDLDYIETNKKAEELLNNYHSAIIRGTPPNGDISLDVCDEWYDALEIPIPIAFWVCRNDSISENIEVYLNSISSQSLPSEESVIEKNYIDGTFPLEGKIIYSWNEEVENALIETIKFLFFHLYLTDIPAVKILGREL
jgi:hypothetical protein